MAQTVELEGLDRIRRSWDALLQRFPEEKRRALSQVGQALLQQVRGQIGGTGKVAGWQNVHLGSGGGYVAVRARAKTYQTTKSGKRYAVGYITNAIEGGHRTGGPRPGPKAAGYRYQPRLRVSAVPGLWFYDTVRRQADSLTQEELDELLGTIIDGLEGRL